MFEVAHAVQQSGQSGLTEVFLYTAAAVVGAVILGAGRAVMKLIQVRQAERRQDEANDKTLSEFLFDVPRDPHTGTPARKGWSTKVDEALIRLAQTQELTVRLVKEVLSEIRPDNNGGHNLRGQMDRIEQSMKNGDDNGRPS